MIRNLVRRLILWSVPEAAAEGGETRPVQENQDPVKLVPRYHGYWRAYTAEELEDAKQYQEGWDHFVKQTSDRINKYARSQRPRG